MGKRRSRKGTGNLYKPPGHQDYYVRFRNKGRDITLPTGTSDRSEAERIRRKFVTEMESGIPLDAHKVTLTDLMELKIRDYQKNDLKTERDMLRHWDRYLLPFFGPATRAMDVTPAQLAAFQAFRKQQLTERKKPVTNGEINRELSTLCSAFNLARQQRILPILSPFYDKLPELRKRTTFWREGEFKTLMKEWKSEWTRPIIQFMNFTGWRVTEVQYLIWAENIDWERKEIILREGTTKSKEPRIFPFHFLPELEQLLKNQLAKTAALEKARDIRIPWVFHRDGEKIVNYYKEWEAAMKAGKFIGKKRHDFRSTAAKRLLGMGFLPHEVCKMVGWESIEMLYYYCCTDAEEISEKARAIAKKAQSLTVKIGGRD